MAETNETALTAENATKTPAVLSGAETCLTGETKLALSVNVTSGTGRSTLMVPDIGGIKNGKPIYITKPVGIVGSKLKKFLAGDDTKEPKVPARADLPKPISDLIEDTTISCDAFYYSTDTTLIMFNLKFDKGAIGSLLGTDIGELFDITGASLRVLKCSEKNYPVLQKYVADLTSE